MLKNLILSLLICTTLSSCVAIIATPQPPTRIGKLNNEFPKNKKGLVIFKMSAPGASKWYRIDEKFHYPKNNMQFINFGQKQEDSGNNIWMYSSKEYQVLMLEPGIYSLDILYTDYNEYIKPRWRYGAWNQDTKEPFLIAFEVKPETINYIGDIEIFAKKITFNKVFPYPKIQDDYSAAKTFFAEKYPDVKGDFIKKLAFGKTKKKNDNENE
jgi:hypothetical protein